MDRVDASGIAATPAPSGELCKRVSKAGLVVCSDLLRAVESARMLAPLQTPVADALFREAALPTGIRVPILLRAHTWAAISRALWLLGWSGSGESLIEARSRAGQAADRLIYYSRERGSVALVAHGVINLLIARQLRARGWQGRWVTRLGNWSSSTFIDEV